MSRDEYSLGVVGAGTMGAGIAQTGLVAGFRVVLFDVAAESLETARTSIRDGIRRGQQRGRWETDADAAVDGRLTIAAELSALAGCDAVVEAAPERLELKQQLFSELMAICGPDTVLASNTSSIPISQLAAGTPEPGRIMGLHFFNPVPLMKLVEVIPAQQSPQSVVDQTTALGEALGKRVILAPDGPGFLVNRCGRAFYGEPLRIVTERTSDPAQIDRICRMAGGFRMGPFELMDLVGLDVNLEIARSFTALSFGEPRWRPTTLQAQMVAGGRLGRKTGRGWYDYSDGPHRPADPPPPEAGAGGGRTLAVVGGDGTAAHLRQLAQSAGFSVTSAATADAVAVVYCDPRVAGGDLADDATCTIVSCAAHSLADRRLTAAVGFNLPNLARNRQVVELTRTSATAAASATAADELFVALGLHVEWVADGPGLVLDRILAQIVNEAMFAYGEGLACAADIDAGVVLGLNYPVGPLAWGAQLGWAQVQGTLDGIWSERREERYRPAPALISAVAGIELATEAWRACRS